MNHGVVVVVVDLSERRRLPGQPVRVRFHLETAVSSLCNTGLMSISVDGPSTTILFCIGASIRWTCSPLSTRPRWPGDVFLYLQWLAANPQTC